MVRVLFECKVDVRQMLISRDAPGETPLHYMSKGVWEGPDLARFLLEHGADVIARRNDHSTPLHMERWRGSRSSQAWCRNTGWRRRWILRSRLR
jgi:hypothetical protein